ncbi:MAG: response regulator [Nitrospirota bacterium]|nr:response regulator [Nitrospirota bacterium]
MKRILIVDDELPILTGLSKALHKLCDFPGEIRTVVNGREAVREVCYCFYDICFLDLQLPDMNGIQVMEDIYDISPETNIILMSASFTETAMDKIKENSDIFYIDKPFNFTQIKLYMKQALEGGNESNGGRASDRQTKTGSRRKFRRKPLEKIIGFYVKDTSNMEFKGGIIDISYAGVGIETYYPLERGQFLFFSRGVAHKTGIVLWSKKNSDSHYRAGIRFV